VRCSEPAGRPAPLGPGTSLGPYQLLLPVAVGGMATIWAAILKGSRGFEKLVAIKTMLPELCSDPRFEQMFLAEAVDDDVRA
jgi:serine/threonine-protein kinase